MVAHQPQLGLRSYGCPPTSMGCNVGGSVIAHGLDNGDGGGTAANGQLESGEVDYSINVAHSGISSSSPSGFTVFNNEL